MKRLPGGDRISGPGELVQAVPYLIGFHPRRSVVLVGLRDGLLVVTARLDLDDVLADLLSDRHPPVGVVAETFAAFARAGALDVVALVYDAAGMGVDAGRQASDNSEASLVIDVVFDVVHTAGSGARLLDLLLVGGLRWRSVLCDEPGCCPVQGQLLSTVPTPFTTAATVEGIAPLPDRGALASTLDPLPDAQYGPLLTALDAGAARLRESVPAAAERARRSTKRALFALVRSAEQRSWPGLTDQSELVRLGVGLADRAIRDALWFAIDDRRLTGQCLWRELARSLPGTYAAAPAFLLAWANWRAGNGAMAEIAVQRALAADPDFEAARLLRTVLGSGLDPFAVPRLRRFARLRPSA